MKQISMIFLILTSLLISGYASTENSMPSKMPDDFDFKVQFGVQSKNVINTYENIVTKDLIMKGTAIDPDGAYALNSWLLTVLLTKDESGE